MVISGADGGIGDPAGLATVSALSIGPGEPGIPGCIAGVGSGSGSYERGGTAGNSGIGDPGDCANEAPQLSNRATTIAKQRVIKCSKGAIATLQFQRFLSGARSEIGQQPDGAARLQLRLGAAPG